MITYSVLSERGTRPNNEDAVKVWQKGDFFCAVLGDGLGGHGFGDLASHIVTENVVNTFSIQPEVSEKAIRKCFEESQNLLLREQTKQRKENSMKTTLCILLADSKQILWGHIGDSRIYHFRHKKLDGRTLDHSVPQILASAGEITEQEIRKHPDRNRLLRVMGVEWDKTPYTLSSIHVNECGHAFLICSDGFWEWIEEKDMASCLRKAHSAGEWLKYMKKNVEKNAKKQDMDNYSAICIWT